MTRARPLVERYCRSRGQVGLSGETHTLAYSLIPLLTIATGGTALIADRSMSFQTIRREAVSISVKDVDDRALPSEAGAAAALVDACMEYYVHTDRLRKTTVDFDDMDGTITIDGLAQGCSLSPTLEAIVIAWQHDQQPQKVHGVCQLTAHDDLVAVAEAGVDASELVLPSCDLVGGSYNPLKSVAFGNGSDLLVANGQAAKKADGGTVWGRPVGPLPQWMRETWLPRFRSRCDRLRYLATVDPAVAIWSAHALKGPGVIANHVLRGIPPAMLQGARWGGQEVMAIFHTADDEWVSLMLHLTGASPTQLASIDRQRARDVIFGSRMGHVSAVNAAPAISASGLAVALPTLLRIADEHHLDVGRWADILGLPQLAQFVHTPVPQQDAAEMLKELTSRAKDEQEAATARTPQADDEADDLCLWVEALAAPRRMHVAVKAADAAAALPETRSAAVRYALARLLRVPVWVALDGLTPTTHIMSTSACGLCQTAVLSADGHACGAGGSSPGTSAGPRGIFDDQGEHIGACLKLCPEASIRVRHDRLVKVCAEMGLQCGFQSRVHDGPILDGLRRQQRTLRSGLRTGSNTDPSGLMRTRPNGLWGDAAT